MKLKNRLSTFSQLLIASMFFCSCVLAQQKSMFDVDAIGELKNRIQVSGVFLGNLKPYRVLDVFSGNEINPEHSLEKIVHNSNSAVDMMNSADFISRYCWDTKLRDSIDQGESHIDFYSLRKSSLQLYENSLTLVSDDYKSAVHNRLANTYTALARLPLSDNEVISYRKLALDSYMQAYHLTKDMNEEKVENLRSIFNTMDVLLKEGGVADDDEVALLLRSGIESGRSEVRNLINSNDVDKQECEFVLTFARVLWQIGDSEYSNSLASQLISVKEAFEESTSILKSMINMPSLSDKTILLDDCDWSAIALEARLWYANIMLDAGYVKLGLLEKSQVIEALDTLSEIIGQLDRGCLESDSKLNDNLYVSKLVLSESKYVFGDWKTAVEDINKEFGGVFSELTAQTPETKITQTAALAQHIKIFCLYELGEFEEVLETAEKLISLEKSHVLPNARNDFWVERQKFLDWGLTALDRDEEALEYRSFLVESYPGIFPEYAFSRKVYNLKKY